MTVCNMVVEAGAKNGTCPCDQVTIDYVTARTSNPFYPVEADGGATYLKEFRFDVSKLEPLVAAPHSPDNRKTAASCKGTKIDRVYIGSCTGGKTEDFMYAAKLFAASGDMQVKVPDLPRPRHPEGLGRRVRAARARGPEGEDGGGDFRRGGVRAPRGALVRGLPGRAPRHVCPHERARGLRVHDQPQLPWAHGAQGRADLPGEPADGRGERTQGGGR